MIIVVVIRICSHGSTSLARHQVMQLSRTLKSGRVCQSKVYKPSSCAQDPVVSQEIRARRSSRAVVLWTQGRENVHQLVRGQFGTYAVTCKSPPPLSLKHCSWFSPMKSLNFKKKK